MGAWHGPAHPEHAPMHGPPAPQRDTAWHGPATPRREATCLPADQLAALNMSGDTRRRLFAYGDERVTVFDDSRKGEIRVMLEKVAGAGCDHGFRQFNLSEVAGAEKSSWVITFENFIRVPTAYASRTGCHAEKSSAAPSEPFHLAPGTGPAPKLEEPAMGRGVRL